jgi:membrane protease YdiL (CAAX protease family)
MPSNNLKRVQLPLFFLFSLIISWAIWIPLAAIKMSNPAAVAATGSPVNILAVWGPGLSAMILSLLIAGKAGLRTLFRPIRIWRVGALWYLFVLLYPAALKLAAYGIDTALGRSYRLTFMPITHYFSPQQAMIMVPAAFIAAVPNALGEELGWRGFALPRLQEKLNALGASVVLGILWGIWHIPMWVMTSGTTGIHELASMLNIAGAAILFTWVYNGTRGSLLLAWLFHFSMTVTGYSLSRIPTATDEIAGWFVIVLVVLVAGPRRLGRA